MFYAIIHNLTQEDAAFEACQNYNKLITQKPKSQGKTLAQTIAAQKEWQNLCYSALFIAQSKLNC